MFGDLTRLLTLLCFLLLYFYHGHLGDQHYTYYVPLDKILNLLEH